MALKFLNTKRWHVRKIANIRKVAIAERKYKEEQTRMAELRREYEEERDLEALRALQEASGRVPTHKTRVEWLYKAPPIKKQEDEEEHITDQDALDDLRAMMPENILNNDLQNSVVRNNLPGVKWLSSVYPAQHDEDIKVREDPMTGIIAERRKQREKEEQERKFLEELEKQQRIKAMMKKPVPLKEKPFIPNFYDTDFDDFINGKTKSEKSEKSEKSNRSHHHHHHHHHHH